MAGLTELPSPDGTRFGPVRLVAETGSTNADLLAAAAEGEPEGSVLVTDHQVSGRGRQQRVWHDQPGSSLLVSILLRPRRDRAPLVPLVAGLAAVDAVTELTGRPDTVGLKWPNDVLAPGHDERKLAGILSEATTAGVEPDTDRLVVVAGMGLNLRWAEAPPAEVAARAVTLAELHGAPIERNLVLDAFLRGAERWYAELESGDGVLDGYRRACLTIGRRVRFTTASGEVEGVASDVSASGTLVLDTIDGPVELHAGDAHHV